VSDERPGLAGVDPGEIRVLLCDADGNLFPSEEPAFAASTQVTNRLLADLGIDRRFEPCELRDRAVGMNFRSTILDLVAEAGVVIDPLELSRRVVDERNAVVRHLRGVLRPDPEVLEPLAALGRRFGLAVVSSSATVRLDACFKATGLDARFPPAVRFSAEDSLPVPTSKPDPAVYAFAGARLDVTGAAGLAVEDAVVGVRSAVAAGFPTVGNLQFVPRAEQSRRAAELREAGAVAVVPSWRHLSERLGVPTGGEPTVLSASSHNVHR
jgi:HAD superfamily hydrolase (TIGR01509 family)